MESLWIKRHLFRMSSNNNNYKAMLTSNRLLTIYLPWTVSSNPSITPLKRRWVPCSSSFKTDSKMANLWFLNNSSSNRIWWLVSKTWHLWISEKSSTSWWHLQKSSRYVPHCKLWDGDWLKQKERVLLNKSFICTWILIFLDACLQTRPWTRDIEYWTDCLKAQIK